MLGLLYDHNIDTWALGTVLYELFTGHVLFPGRVNNEMLHLQMEVKGRFSNKMIRSHIRQYSEVLNLDPHFENDLRFRLHELDPVTGKDVLRLVDVNSVTSDLRAVLQSSKTGGDDRRIVMNLCELIESCLVLDPAKRISVQEALRHPFFSTK